MSEFGLNSKKILTVIQLTRLQPKNTTCTPSCPFKNPNQPKQKPKPKSNQKCLLRQVGVGVGCINSDRVGQNAGELEDTLREWETGGKPTHRVDTANGSGGLTPSSLPHPRPPPPGGEGGLEHTIAYRPRWWWWSLSTFKNTS